MGNWIVHIFVIIGIFIRCSEQTELSKNKTVSEIIQKLSDLTAKSFSSSNKNDIIKKINEIENKIKKAAEHLGEDKDRYVDFIMRGVKLLASNYTNPTKTEPAIAETSSAEKMRNFNLNNSMEQDQNTKDKIVKGIADNVENVARHYMHHTNTVEDKRKIIEQIKRKMLDLADKRHKIIHDKHDDIKTLSDLLGKGMELVLRKFISNDTRRVDVEFLNNVYNVNFAKNYSDQDETKFKDQKKKNNNEINVNNDYNFLTTLGPLSVYVPCEDAVEQACNKIRDINEMECPFNQSEKIIPVEKLCDGVHDCNDNSDERECIPKVIKKIEEASKLMTEIEYSILKRCASSFIDAAILTKQNALLSEILERQLKFIQKYSNSDVKTNNSEIGLVKKTVNEVALVLSSLSLGLEGSICTQNTEAETERKILRKHNIMLNPVDELESLGTEEPPQQCNCEKGFCVEADCSVTCRRVCWQKHSLDRWGCQAVTGGTNVPLDVICDGKLDCFDETDENDCATGSLSKFEANNMYNNILSMLSVKAISNEYEIVRSKLLMLHKNIQNLQKLTLKHNPDIISVKTLRDSCFSGLVSIYGDIIKNVDWEEVEEIHLFLLTISEKLVFALKRSFTGNDKIVAVDGCYCIGNRCGIPKCSKKCIRSCAVETKLTKYACKGASDKDTYVPIDDICDGVNNCPNGDDEAGCKKEVCRRHHLVVLRHGLQDVDAKHRGTAVGEALQSWKAKVNSTLIIAENNGRPTKAVLKDVINNLLRDLVASYATIEDYRRKNHDTVFTVFSKLSRQVMETIKSCGM